MGRRTAPKKMTAMPTTVENLQTALDAVFDQLNAEAESQLLNRDIPFIGALGGVADVAPRRLPSDPQPLASERTHSSPAET